MCPNKRGKGGGGKKEGEATHKARQDNTHKKKKKKPRPKKKRGRGGGGGVSREARYAKKGKGGINMFVNQKGKASLQIDRKKKNVFKKGGKGKFIMTLGKRGRKREKERQ